MKVEMYSHNREHEMLFLAVKLPMQYHQKDYSRHFLSITNLNSSMYLSTDFLSLLDGWLPKTF